MRSQGPDAVSAPAGHTGKGDLLNKPVILAGDTPGMRGWGHPQFFPGAAAGPSLKTNAVSAPADHKENNGKIFK